MADFLKSAASYFSSTATSYSANGGSGGESHNNPLVGTVVQVNSMQLRIKRQIGEGKQDCRSCSDCLKLQFSPVPFLCRWLCLCFYCTGYAEWSGFCIESMQYYNCVKLLVSGIISSCVQRLIAADSDAVKCTVQEISFLVTH